MNHIFKNYKIYILGYVPSQIDVESRKRFAEAEMALSRSGFRNIRNKVKVLEDKKLTTLEASRYNLNMLIESDAVYLLSDKSDRLSESVELKIAMRLNLVVIHDMSQAIDPFECIEDNPEEEN